MAVAPSSSSDLYVLTKLKESQITPKKIDDYLLKFFKAAMSNTKLPSASKQLTNESYKKISGNFKHESLSLFL